jgi:hypothetical protein
MMKWKKLSSVTAISECGRYEVRIARLSTGKPFYNAWHIPTNKHIEASFDKAIVKAACEAHAEKVSRETKAA